MSEEVKAGEVKRKKKLVKPSICYECYKIIPCWECNWRGDWHYEWMEA